VAGSNFSGPNQPQWTRLHGRGAAFFEHVVASRIPLPKLRPPAADQRRRHVAHHRPSGRKHDSMGEKREVLNHWQGLCVVPIFVCLARNAAPRQSVWCPISLALRPKQLRAAAEESALLIPAAAQLQSQYARIKCPVRLFHGDQDHFIECEQSRHLHRALPRSALHFVQNAGHMAHYADPRIISETVEALARLDAGFLCASRSKLTIALDARKLPDIFGRHPASARNVHCRNAVPSMSMVTNGRRRRVR
jgi:pimeloyl-ACP methyl ester carboxylesterase